MGKWYKIPKESPTGKRLQVVLDRRIAFQEAWLKFGKKYGMKSCIYYSEHLCDAVAFEFDHEPDATLWHKLLRGDLKDAYKPVKGTEAYKEWQKLRKLRVEYIELDHAMGETSDFPDVGFHWGNDEFFFVHYKFGPNYELGEECEPISDAEFRVMTGDKSDWRSNNED